MKTSVIRHRVADFLKHQAPFDALPEEDLLALAGSGRVQFHESDEYIMRQRQPKGPFVWIIQQGRVELIDERASGPVLCDVLGEGDLVGLSRFAGDGTAIYSALTRTDVILYAVDAASFDSLAERHTAVREFIHARLSVADAVSTGRGSWLDLAAPPLEFLRARRTRASDYPGEGERPPVLSPPVTVRAAVRAMLEARSAEVAVAPEGGAIVGVLTAADLALFCDRNPAGLAAAIRGATSTAELVPLLGVARRMLLDGLARPTDVDDCSFLGGELLAALAEACICRAHCDVLAAGIDPPGAPYCWVLFGAAARGDLLLPALPVIAAVYDDTAASAGPADGAYFTALAGETAAWFHACGLEGPGLYWPEGARPCMPVSEWQRLYRETIRSPLGHDLFARREFFDLKRLSGDAAVFARMRQHIVAELGACGAVIPLLANDTLAHLPPLTFFRGLVLDLDGGQRDRFDIQRSLLSPVADAARVFAVSRGRLQPAGTLERLEAASPDFPEAADALREAAHAFRIAQYHQAVAGTAEIAPARLGKYEQIQLKGAFSIVQRLLSAVEATFMHNS